MNHTKRLLGWLFLALVLTVWSVVGVAAAPPVNSSSDGGTVLIGQDWTLPAGETYRGDVVIVSGDATVEEGATLIGDLAVVSGDATVRGTVQGDVAVVSGDVFLGAKSVVTGDVSFVSGELTRETGSVVQGDIVYGNISVPLQGVPVNVWPQMFQALRWAGTFAPPQPGTPEWFFARLMNFIGTIVGAFFTAIVTAAVAAFLAAVWPEPLRRVSDTIQKAPVPDFLVGLVVAIAALVLGILFVITICLSPFGLLLIFGLVAAWLMGWAAVGIIVGQRLWDALNQPQTSDVLPAAVGTFLVSLISAVPCVGTLFGLIVGMVGLGAVVLSYFGTRVPETI